MNASDRDVVAEKLRDMGGVVDVGYTANGLVAQLSRANEIHSLGGLVSDGWCIDLIHKFDDSGICVQAVPFPEADADE